VGRGLLRLRRWGSREPRRRIKSVGLCEGGIWVANWMQKRLVTSCLNVNIYYVVHIGRHNELNEFVAISSGSQAETLTARAGRYPI